MSMPHHEVHEQSELMKLFKAQKELKERAPRQWPDGRISGDDEGAIAFQIGSDPEKQLVAIEYAKPVGFVAMSPQDAIQLAQLLIKHARAISREPLSIQLH